MLTQALGLPREPALEGNFLGELGGVYSLLLLFLELLREMTNTSNTANEAFQTADARVLPQTEYTAHNEHQESLLSP